MRTQTQKSIARHLPKTREQKRQQEREKKKGEVTYTFTVAQIEQMKNEATMAATKHAFLMMLGFPLLALRDEFGFGKVRLNRMMDKLMTLYEAYENDYIDLDDLNDTIMKETGMTITTRRVGKK